MELTKELYYFLLGIIVFIIVCWIAYAPKFGIFAKNLDIFQHKEKQLTIIDVICEYQQWLNVITTKEGIVDLLGQLNNDIAPLCGGHTIKINLTKQEFNDMTVDGLKQYIQIGLERLKHDVTT